MRYLRPFLVLLILTSASAVLLLAIFNKARNDAKSHIFTHEQMLAELIKNSIEDYFSFEVSQTEFLAASQDVIVLSEEGKGLLRQFFATQSKNLQNITRVDRSGKISFSYPNVNVIGSYVGNQEHVKTIFRTQRPVLSSIFRTVQGYDAIALHVPVFRSGEFDGTLALVIPFEEICRRHIGSVRIGTNGTAVLFDETGVILYSKNDKDIGERVEESEFKFYMSKLRVAGRNEYMSKPFTRPNKGTISNIGDSTQIIAYVAPVKNQNITWFIKVAMPESEAIGYVSGFSSRWTILFVSAIALFTIWGVVLSRAIVVARKEEEKRLSNERVLKAEQETILARALLVNAVDQSPAGIIIVDATTGKMLLINDAARLSGCIKIGTSTDDFDASDPNRWLFLKPDGSRYDAGDVPIVQSLVSGRTVVNEEVLVRNDEDGEFWYSVNSAPVFGQKGDIIAAITVLQDITEQMRNRVQLRDANLILEKKVAERTVLLQESVAELEAFSYSVSHDLRAPLRHLSGYSSILLNDYSERLDDEATGYLNSIMRSAQNMSVLIDSLLHLSRISRAEVKCTQVDLAEISRLIVQELDLAAIAEDRHIHVTIDPTMVVKADASFLQIVMRNLLSNAWKFTSKVDKAAIEVGLVQQDGESHIYVKDNGAGFNMEYVGKLFSAFQRLHSPAEFPGTGIGLTTVQRIVKKHGGRVWAEGKEGEGATFWFSLPS